MRRVTVENRCTDFASYRAARVKSLFNVESGANFTVEADLPADVAATANGDRIDGFVLKARLHQGGMATLWSVERVDELGRAVHPPGEPQLIMKVPRIKGGEDPATIVGFEVERMIMAGEIAPGDRVNENQLALRFGTSRGAPEEVASARLGLGGDACHPNPGGGRFAQAKSNRPGMPGVVVVVCVEASTDRISAPLAGPSAKDN